MRHNKCKKLLTGLFITLSLILSACSSSKQLPVDEPKTTDAATTSTEPAQDENKLSVSDIEKLAAENVYNVHWYTSTEGDFSAGTSFIMDSDKFGGKILVTAFHYLVPDGEEKTFKGKDLPNFVQGGTLIQAKSKATTGSSLKNCIVIEDAAAVPVINKDVAAFTLYNAGNLNTLPLSTHPLKMGDKLYLLASLWKGDNLNENCVYEGLAVMDINGEMSFKLNKCYDTTGGSGGPIVNEYGEVVGIHMASSQDNSIMYAHSSESFLAQINAGTVSNVTYEEKPEVMQAADEDVPAYYHKSDDLSAETCFFNMKITGVETVDKLGDAESHEGYKFAIVSTCIDTVGLNVGDFNLFSEDFCVFWDDDYSPAYGYEETHMEDLAHDTTLIADNSINYLKYAFEIPESFESMILYFMDYYYDASDVFHEVAEHYFEIPLNGF